MRQTVLICDNCNKLVEENGGAVVKVIFHDARRGQKNADYCDTCADAHPGHKAARRQRRSRAEAA